MPVARGFRFTLVVLACSALACTDSTSTTPLEPGGSTFSRGSAAVASITVSPDHVSLAVGEKADLSAAVVKRRGWRANYTQITWASENTDIARVSRRGVVTAVSAGVVRITATIGTTVGAATVTVTGDGAPTPPPPTTGEWTYCTAAGAPCDFIGLRDVRLGAANGPYVIQTAYHDVPCASYGFGGQNPAPNRALHCDYGPIKTVTLVNPSPGMLGMQAQVTVPLGAPGASGPRARSASGGPSYTDGSGSFRIVCSLATYDFADPIVSPGQPGASHLHMFFGNTGVNAGSTAQSIGSSGNSTCPGGILNRTAYWTPAMIDTRTGAVQVPDEAVFYYKTGYNVDPKVVQAFPVGLRMVAGNKLATSRQEYISWSCRDHYRGEVATIPTTCPAGDAVRLTVEFPQCWDGRNLDSPNHQSHMAHPNYRNPPQRSTCPASHPIAVPEITEHFDFPVAPGAALASWRLSSDMYGMSLPGGYSAHADWFDGWDDATMRTIVKQCLNKALDCQVGFLGDGRELY